MKLPGFAFATTLGAQTSIGSLPIYYYGERKTAIFTVSPAEISCLLCIDRTQLRLRCQLAKTTATLLTMETYSLNGHKIWITNVALIFLSYLQKEDDKNLSAFIVERNYPGFSVGAEAKKMGIKASSTVQIFLIIV